MYRSSFNEGSPLLDWLTHIYNFRPSLHHLAILVTSKIVSLVLVVEPDTIVTQKWFSDKIVKGIASTAFQCWFCDLSPGGTHWGNYWRTETPWAIFTSTRFYLWISFLSYLLFIVEFIIPLSPLRENLLKISTPSSNVHIEMLAYAKCTSSRFLKSLAELSTQKIHIIAIRWNVDLFKIFWINKEPGQRSK